MLQHANKSNLASMHVNQKLLRMLLNLSYVFLLVSDRFSLTWIENSRSGANCSNFITSIVLYRKRVQE